MKPTSFLLLYGATAFALALTGCTSTATRVLRREEPPPPPDYIQAEAKKTSQLTEEEFLMRKATIGSRSERLEALSVIERSRNRDFIPFLLERLNKEDDDFLRIRIMHALAAGQDVRAVEPIRAVAAKENNRVGIEAVVALFELGDDNYIPKLIRMLRMAEQLPELAGISHRTLKRLYETDLPPSARAWNNHYRSHRLAPYQQVRWYARLNPPLPPTVEGTTQVEPQAKVSRLPQEDVRVRRSYVTLQDFWRADDP